jgi:hypothetical protein
MIVAHWHGHVDPDIFGEDTLYAVGKFYNNALIGVESNNHGLTTLKGLQRAGYKNIFRQRKLNQINPQISETLGWRTTSVSKPLAIDELNAAIRDMSILLYDFKTIAELRTFVRESSGKMHGSPHDDRVMSLAITNQMLKYVWLPEYRQLTEDKFNTLGWWEKHLIKKKEVKEGMIGSSNVRK